MPRTKLALWLLKNPTQAELLRRTAQTIPQSEMQTPEFQRLIDDMLITMPQARGVGLAAPQVGRSIRLAVIDGQANHRNEPYILINPVIQITDHQEDELEEGCLSIPKVYGKVLRPIQLRLKAFDRDGNPYSLVAEDFFARVIQHEVDHLQGRLFVDRVSEITAGHVPNA